jgi:hypothetical protein
VKRVGQLSRFAIGLARRLREHFVCSLVAEDLILVCIVEGREQQPVARTGTVLARLPVQLDHVREGPDRRQPIAELLQLAGKISSRPRPRPAQLNEPLRP